MYQIYVSKIGAQFLKPPVYFKVKIDLTCYTMPARYLYIFCWRYIIHRYLHDNSTDYIALLYKIQREIKLTDLKKMGQRHLLDGKCVSCLYSEYRQCQSNLLKQSILINLMKLKWSSIYN